MTDRAVRAVVAVVAVLAAVVLIGAAASSGRPSSITRISKAAPTAQAEPTATTKPKPEPEPPVKQGSTRWTFGGILLAIVAVFAMGFLYALSLMRHASWFPRRFRIEDRGGTDDLDQPGAAIRAELVDAAEAALRMIDDGEPDEAVIACWVLLERAAADAGVGRQPAETAAELTARVLASYDVDASTLRELADRYREARYSSHAIGEPGRDRARALLSRVREQLAPALHPAAAPARLAES
jgi:Domain of unknown function (DUF4129)